MANLRSDLTLNEVYITEAQKNSATYLEGMMDYWIGKLVIDKKHIPICRKYYSGKRSTEEFEYLADNYGIGNPIDIQFTPIIKPRIDALVGMFLNETFSYRIAIADDKTLDLEEEEKKNYIITNISQQLEKASQAVANYQTDRRQGGASAPPSELLSEEFMANMKEYLDTDFISVYAGAAQHLIYYFEQSGTLDFKRKFAELLYDLLITGEMFWRNSIPYTGKDPEFEVVKPENLFFSQNKNSIYLDNPDAVVHREYMTRHQVLQKYGHLMTDKEVKELSGRWGGYGNHRNISDPEILHEDIYDEEFSNFRQYTGDLIDVVDVLHVEWLASSRYEKAATQDRNPVENKKALKKTGWIEHRYEGVRILGNMYIGAGRSKNVVRSQQDPYKASLSYGGMSYNIRQGEVYSMVWNLKDVQDMYDITQFYRNNLVATAGVAGSRVNIAGIPKVLGGDFMDRLMKWVALRKQGIELIDPSEEGAQLFNHYGEFQGGIDGNAINGINSILATLMQQVVLTTGVTDQMLGQIEQREAVENVKTGIRQVSLITLNIFDLLDGARKRALTNLIDLSKISFTKGKQGSYKVGYKSVAFKIDRDNFTWTDYNINVTNSSKDSLKLQKLEQLTMELISAGAVKPDIAVELALANTIFEAKKIIRKGMMSDEEKQQQMQQMEQKIQEYEQQLKDLSGQAGKAQQDKDKFSAEQMQLDREKFEFEKGSKQRELDIKQSQQKADESYKVEEIRSKREIVQLEREQLYLEGGNSNAREVNNNKI